MELPGPAVLPVTVTRTCNTILIDQIIFIFVPKFHEEIEFPL